MTDDHVSRRRLLLAAGFAGALSGCTDLFDDDSADDSEDASSSPTETATASPTPIPTESSTATSTETATPEPSASIEITETSLREETVTAGDAIEVEIVLENSGDADGTKDVTLELAGEEVLEEQIDVPAGEDVNRVLTSPEASKTGTLTVSLDGQTVGDVTVRPSDVLHVAPDGSDEGAGTEDAPLSSIQAAVEWADPGQTVYVHSGEYVEAITFETDGEPNAPITLTGPPDAILTPPREWEAAAILVNASHVHVTGLTITGLYNPDEPKNAESYHSGKLIELNNAPKHGEDYVEGIVVSPHRMGNAGQALINSQMIKDCDIGGFKVIGPAGASWLFDESFDQHNGEFVYLGSADSNRRERGFEGFDRTRNVRVHHIDNSEGYPHSELVDCKGGVRDVTIEYCTDGGGSQVDDSYYSQSISLGGYQCTVRWNVIQNAHGSGVEIPVGGAMETPEALGDPQPGIVERMGTENAIYGNVFTGNTLDAVDFFGESHKPGHGANPLPEDQRALCGNLFDGFSDAEPGTSCPSDLPQGDGVGHLGGDSPWSGDPPTKESVFERDALAQDLETTVEGDSVPTGTEFEVTVTITNTGDSSKEVIVRLRVDESVLASETVIVGAGETRTVRLSDDLPNPGEVAVTRNGQKIGYARVTDD